MKTVGGLARPWVQIPPPPPFEAKSASVAAICRRLRLHVGGTTGVQARFGYSLQIFTFPMAPAVPPHHSGPQSRVLHPLRFPPGSSRHLRFVPLSPRLGVQTTPQPSSWPRRFPRQPASAGSVRPASAAPSAPSQSTPRTAQLCRCGCDTGRWRRKTVAAGVVGGVGRHLSTVGTMTALLLSTGVRSAPWSSCHLGNRHRCAVSH